jgi:tetratricopeptide (TPR) repeat protein
VLCVFSHWNLFPSWFFRGAVLLSLTIGAPLLSWAESPISNRSPGHSSPVSGVSSPRASLLAPPPLGKTLVLPTSLSTEERLSHLEKRLGLAEDLATNPEMSRSLRFRLEQLYASLQQNSSPEQKQQAIQRYNQAIDAEAVADFTKAKALYQEALTLNPRFLEASNNLAHLFEKQDLFKEAICIYLEALPYHPEAALLYRNLGVLYQKQGQMDRAIEAFESYLALSPVKEPSIVEVVTHFHRNTGTASPDYLAYATEASFNHRLRWPTRWQPLPTLIVLKHPEQAVFYPVLREAMASWTKALEGRVRFEETQAPSVAKLIIELHPLPFSQSYERVGHAAFEVDLQAPIPEDTLRVIMRVHTGLPNQPLSPARVAQVKRLLLHELGHAIGIWGHSPDPGDVMFTHPIANELSKRDSLTAMRLYDLTPGGPSMWQRRQSVSPKASQGMASEQTTWQLRSGTTPSPDSGNSPSFTPVIEAISP